MTRDPFWKLISRLPNHGSRLTIPLTPAGLAPTTLRVRTGRSAIELRSLNKNSDRTASNRQPLPYQGNALPIELRSVAPCLSPQHSVLITSLAGVGIEPTTPEGAADETADLPRVHPALVAAGFEPAHPRL